VNFGVFALKYTPSGSVVWTKRFGDNGYDSGLFIATDLFGAPVITGRFSGTADFGQGPLQAVGAGDIFLAKLAP
jgi:hypothetical protein